MQTAVAEDPVTSIFVIRIGPDLVKCDPIEDASVSLHAVLFVDLIPLTGLPYVSIFHIINANK